MLKSVGCLILIGHNFVYNKVDINSLTLMFSSINLHRVDDLFFFL